MIVSSSDMLNRSFNGVNYLQLLLNFVNDVAFDPELTESEQSYALGVLMNVVHYLYRKWCGSEWMSDGGWLNECEWMMKSVNDSLWVNEWVVKCEWWWVIDWPMLILPMFMAIVLISL